MGVCSITTHKGVNSCGEQASYRACYSGFPHRRSCYVVRRIFSILCECADFKFCCNQNGGRSCLLDTAFAVPVTSISWGIVEPGEVKNVSCYIKNTSNVPIILTLKTDNYTPAEAEQYISLTWNYDEQPIPVDGYTPITFSLHVDPATTGITAFSFDITITGSG